MSVDPLVAVTMQPYIYGAANPVTFSDPSGLCPFAGCWEQFDRVLLEATGSAEPGYARGREYQVDSRIADSVLDGYGGSFANGNQQYGRDDFDWARDLNCNAFVPCDSASPTWRSFVGLAKNIVVGAAAVGAAGAFCGATAGLGCVVIAGAAGGAAMNVVLSEGEDCIQGASCREFSLSESGGDAFDGALLGAGAGVTGRAMALTLGSGKGAVGVIHATRKFGAVGTLDAIVTTGGVRVYVSGVRMYVNTTTDYVQGRWHR